MQPTEMEQASQERAGTLDQDVKLPTIEPHASAFWTVVDFDSLSFGQQQIKY
jgi:hypothetical protein